jgi:tripartite-type tricarboxylate transporter receptor subunit TctC
MILPRRRCLRLGVGAVALPALSHMGLAQTYPTRPVHLIVGFAAGGSVDIVARLMGQWLSEQTGRQIIIENRAGAGTNIATEAVVKARPDGYTLLLVTASNAVNKGLYDNLAFDFVRDIEPVAGIVSLPYVMEVNPSVPVKALSEFIDYAKANPGSLNMASSGNGSASHISGELFKMMAGVDMLHVPYRGSPLPDLLGGRVHVYFSPISSSIEYIRTGRLRALAVTSVARQQALPDIPTVAEFVPGYESRNWSGIGAPRGTPAAIIDRLNQEINAALVDPKMTVRLTELGGTVLAGTPADFGRLIADETEKWGKVIRTANIKPG